MNSKQRLLMHSANILAWGTIENIYSIVVKMVINIVDELVHVFELYVRILVAN